MSIIRQTAAIWERSLSLKILIIGVLTLLLLIPTEMVKGLIKERKGRSSGAVNEISSKWAYSQSVTGPVLTIPYKKLVRRADNDLLVTETRYAHFMPDNLDIASKLNSEVRRRGIFEAVLYSSRVRLEGTFLKPSFEQFDIADEDVMWDKAYVELGISDLRGIKNSVALTWNDTTIGFSPGIANSDISSAGISAPVKAAAADRYSYAIDIDLNGSNYIHFAPVGRVTSAQVTSDYKKPAFSGSFLPDEKVLTDTGFSATWRVTNLNRSFPQQWLGNAFSLKRGNDRNVQHYYTDETEASEVITSGSSGSFGVTLLLPVDAYQKSMRTAKYAVMFLILTFMAFLFSEMSLKLKVHPLQYLLIGLAIVLFYTLLLSFSEHISFNSAYLLSAAAIILLIALYARGIFAAVKPAVVVGSILAVLYLYMFVLLQMEEYALLMGSIGLFVVLAVAMYFTRRINRPVPEQEEVATA